MEHVVTSEAATGSQPQERAVAELARSDYELVMVTYRSRRHFTGFLDHVGVDVPIVVVDNSGNSDGIKEDVLARPGARYLDGGGVGFARAANLGARSSTRDVVVFVNPDSRPSVADLETLVDEVTRDTELAACGATPVGSDGRPEIGVGGWEPTPLRALVHTVGLHKIFPNAGLFARPDLHEEIELDWMSGACMAVRRSVFDELGGFDESFYVYNEDMAFGGTVRSVGMRSKLRTDVLVRHTAGGSGAPNQEMLRLRGASMAMYAHRELPPGRAGLVCGVLAVGSLARGALAVLRGDRPLAQGYLQYVLGILTRDATVGGRTIYRGGVRVDGAEPPRA